MLKLLIAIVFSQSLWFSCWGQIPAKAFKLSNSLHKLWHKGKTEKAVDYSLELHQLYRQLLIERIHNTLAPMVQNGQHKNAMTYLEQLTLEANQEMIETIAPIHLWLKSIEAKTESDFKNVIKDLNQLLANKIANYESRNSRYCLLVLQELSKKKAISHNLLKEILQKNISNLETSPFIQTAPVEKQEQEIKSWQRYLLAYSFNCLYAITSTKEYLKKAADYSPDLTDRMFKNAYFYDAIILKGNLFGFQDKYQQYLIEDQQDLEALQLLTHLAFSCPSNENVHLLRNHYEKLNRSVSFSDYWEKYIDAQGKPVPQVKLQFEKEELDLTKKQENWIFIDVWGTWCKPCCKELPKLQSLFNANKKNQKSKLKIYSLSFASRNLLQFMSRNHYTFPVCEIDKEINDLFEITQYPTKILISPNGNYFKIPGEDWEISIKNYMLMNS